MEFHPLINNSSPIYARKLSIELLNHSFRNPNHFFFFLLDLLTLITFFLLALPGLEFFLHILDQVHLTRGNLEWFNALSLSGKLLLSGKLCWFTVRFIYWFLSFIYLVDDQQWGERYFSFTGPRSIRKKPTAQMTCRECTSFLGQNLEKRVRKRRSHQVLERRISSRNLQRVKPKKNPVKPQKNTLKHNKSAVKPHKRAVKPEWIKTAQPQKKIKNKNGDEGREMESKDGHGGHRTEVCRMLGHYLSFSQDLFTIYPLDSLGLVSILQFVF